MRYFLQILSALCALGLVACGSNTETKKEAEIKLKGDSVFIDANSPICSKLTLQTLKEEQFSDEFRTVGTAQAEAGHFAEVCSPFDGRVTRAAVRIGDHVKAGQCLYELTSSDFAAASKEYLQAVRNYEKASAEYQRKKTLCAHGVASQRELDEARTEAENARSEREAAAATLRVFNVNPSQMKMGQSLRVCSPIDGEVVACNITPGKYVKSDDEPMVTVADLNNVWVTAQIKERYLGRVSMGGEAAIHIDSAPDSEIEAKVFNIGNIVDDETRSVQVILTCNNANRLLKHGMFVSVHFKSEPKPTIVVPSTAIFQGEQRSYVFVATGVKNCYVRREVELGNASDDNKRVSIVSGLKAGEQIVAVGGLYLND